MSERLDAIEARDEAVGPLLEVPHLSEGYMALLDRRTLLTLARKQAAALESVERLALGWTLRGESDMAFSKTLPDPDIADAILTNGAAMVENARHIRNALEATK